MRQEEQEENDHDRIRLRKNSWSGLLLLYLLSSIVGSFFQFDETKPTRERGLTVGGDEVRTVSRENKPDTKSDEDGDRGNVSPGRLRRNKPTHRNAGLGALDHPPLCPS